VAVFAAAGESPMEQFAIKRILNLSLGGYDISFTNSTLWMLIAVGGMTAFLIAAMRGAGVVPTRLQSMAELCYTFIRDMVKDVCGEEGIKFFPLIFTIFVFILACNLLGLLPASFTVTSHIAVTFALAFFVFLLVVGVGFYTQGIGFLKMFVPQGVPMALLPLITIIEVMSFLMRPVSMAVRLFANMIAGHILLKVFAGFVVGMGVMGGWAPLVFMAGFTGFEVLVACLQAFIFALLTCIYLNDALHSHH
jgi:F-type H+-transporting ATPase subunit a